MYTFIQLGNAPRMEPDRLRDHAQGRELVGMYPGGMVFGGLLEEFHAGLERPGALLGAGLGRDAREFLRASRISRFTKGCRLQRRGKANVSQDRPLAHLGRAPQACAEAGGLRPRAWRLRSRAPIGGTLQTFGLSYGGRRAHQAACRINLEIAKFPFVAATTLRPAVSP